MMYAKMQKAIAVLILTPVVILLVTGIFSALVDDGVIFQVWLSMITQIPFGNMLGELATNLFADSVGMGMDMSRYLIVSQPVTILNILEDSCRLIFAALFFEAVNFACQSFLGVWRKQSGLHNILMQMCIGIIAIVLCTFIATVVTEFLYNQIALLPNTAQGIISAIVSALTIAGAYGVTTFVLGGSVLGIIVFVVVKMLLVNILKVLASYVGIMLLLLFLNEGAYLKAFGVISSWGVVIILLVGVDIMMSSLFKN